ncbi:XdhC/CoxI family protein [Gramella sp. AN32]|uniref:XdhC family protein n=1 Tax=Christiangramia antarctica TaxID=2058158 RepID=A0ABW5X4U2_9FLAO|nr:XdhC/CoxI family protein [Gramella sp. AN32]MCM4156216.1 XshC-Cox1-family protein [Gramella sp. AN32]
MTHEFKKLIYTAFQNSRDKIRNVMASVVALKGSSYRKPGVRMLISENGKMAGAVSGGCVEKEIFLQAQEVFKTGIPKMMAYDGRYKLGCEGILYILLEPFEVSEKELKLFEAHFEARISFKLYAAFSRNIENNKKLGTIAEFENGENISFAENFPLKESSEVEIFIEELSPLFKLVIIGAEHDAVQLCSMAAMMGWEVSIVDSPKDPKLAENFPGSKEILHLFPEQLHQLKIDENTAVVLMNHSYVTDLKFLMPLRDKNPCYIGILGSVTRREKLFEELLELEPETDAEFLDKIYSPAGLPIGAETPQEIANSIIAEILSVIREKEIAHLREINGKIHEDVE